MSRSRVVTTVLLMCGCSLLAGTWAEASAPRGPQGACPCLETVATYPYVEDFEEGMGLWINVEGDDFDWERNQGSTPTDETGPDVDHTLGTDEGHYMYTEASGDNFPDKTAIFVGPCFDLSSLSAPEMSFWYHMAGDAMGSLYLEVSVDDCATWDLVFEMEGSQGYDWHLAVVDLSGYAGETFAVRFRGVTGYYYTSDMAIDDIYVGEAVDYPGGCCDLDTGECLGLMTEADCLAQGNVAWYLMSDCSEDNFCPQPPPANDLCEGAVVIDSLPFTDWEVDFTWVTGDQPVSCDGDECDEGGYGVWYTYTPTEYCGARITTDGGMQAFIAAFTGNDCGDLAEVYCSSDQEDWNKLEATFNMDAGTTYWILVGKFHCESVPWTTINIMFDCTLGACCLGETCSLETVTDCEDAGGYYFGDDTTCEPDACLYGACCTSNGCESLTAEDCAAAAGDFLGNGVPCYLDTCPPGNETCDTAFAVTDGAPAAQGDTTLASTDDDEEASCYEWSDKDLWYAYTATCTGTVAVDTEGSEVWGTVLSVWNECGGDEIACASEGPSGSLAALEFDAIAGLTYYIRVALYEFADGMFQINISCTEAPQGACCFGDTCMVDYQLTCEAAGGSYGGDDTSCPGEDCNGTGVEDICDIVNGDSEDCNENHIPDECDIDDETSLDRDGNGVPDECDPDCNENGIIDGCDVTCDGGCAEIDGCGQSDDCQPDGIPDECQLEYEGCDGVRHDQGEADLVAGVRPDWGWANYGIADDFTLDEDMDGTCFRFDIYDYVDSGNLPVLRVRIFENYDGLMDLGPFWEATPVFDQTYSLDDGTLEIFDTGEHLAGYDLLRFVASGTDWSLSEGDYAMHLTFPETGGAGFWATAGTDDSDCAVYWGDWWAWPSETCDGGPDLTRLSFALLGPENNDCNENGIPDDCDIIYCDGSPWCLDCNGNGVPDGCEPDCNGNGIADECDISDCDGSAWCGDCNENGVPDECDIADGATDCQPNGIPDECEEDCNGNGIVDDCDIRDCDGSVWCGDCNEDGIPNECQTGKPGGAVYEWDDGSAENSLGLGVDAAEIAWIQRFVAIPGSETIVAVSTCFGSAGGAPGVSGVGPGDPFHVFVWEDPDGDGNPMDAVLLGSAQAFADEGSIDTDVLQEVAIEAVTVSGSFFVGAAVVSEMYPAPMDADGELAHESWVTYGWVEEGGFDPTAIEFVDNTGDIGFPCNWLLRAASQPGPAPNDLNGNGIPDECDPSLDIKPGSCPNWYNPQSHGVLPVALVGKEHFDVTMVDSSTVGLWRADGVGGGVAPHEGPPGPHTVIADVASPFDGTPCDCHKLTGDGIDDVSMKFKTDDVMTALELGDVPVGTDIPLELSGCLVDGTPFIVVDCVRIVASPVAPPGTISITSNMDDAWIDVDAPDLTSDMGGFTDFTRYFPLDTPVTLTADGSYGASHFLVWKIDGVAQPRGQQSVNVTISTTGQVVDVEALFRARKVQPEPGSPSGPMKGAGNVPRP